jgi:hypothetical protein
MLQLSPGLFVVATLAAVLITQPATLTLAQTTPTPLTSLTCSPRNSREILLVLPAESAGSYKPARRAAFLCLSQSGPHLSPPSMK